MAALMLQIQPLLELGDLLEWRPEAKDAAAVVTQLGTLAEAWLSSIESLAAALAPGDPTRLPVKALAALKRVGRREGPMPLTARVRLATALKPFLEVAANAAAAATSGESQGSTGGVLSLAAKTEMRMLFCVVQRLSALGASLPDSQGPPVSPPLGRRARHHDQLRSTSNWPLKCRLQQIVRRSSSRRRPRIATRSSGMGMSG